MLIPIKKIVLEDGFLNNEDFEKLQLENKTYKHNNPIESNLDFKKLMDATAKFGMEINKNPELKDLLTNPNKMDIPSQHNYIDKFVDEVKSNNFSNPTTSKFFDHLKVSSKAYNDSNNYINSLPESEKNAINDRLSEGNNNLGIKQLNNKPLFNLYNNEMNNFLKK